MRLLLDEHVDPDVAARLRERGFDVVALTDDAERRGSSDVAVLERAVAERRAVVTYDVRDYRVLAEERVLNEEHHFGVILLTRRRFRHGREHAGKLVDGLAALLLQNPTDEALMDREHWLSRG